MSKHYDDRYYGREEVQEEYDDHRRSSSRRRSTSRPRHSRQANTQDDPYYRQQRMTRSGSGSSISSMSDYEYRAQCSGERAMVRVPRDVIRAPTPPPVIQRVVERAPTPEPDIVERVIVRPQPQQLIERIIERPRTPPPKIIDKEICEPAPPPIVRTRIVKVDHSPRHYANTNPVRYVQNGVRTGLCNYGDYDLGYDQSYSTSYSTTELFQPNNYPTYASASAYQPSQIGQPQIQVTYTPGASQLQMPSQAGFAPPQPSVLGGGFTYGYRPAGMQNYPSQPQMPPNPAGYPRQF